MDVFETELNRLNSQQKQAVETIFGPVMVVAGPGTGKTQILALRIANILKQTDSLPQNILCLTFTEAGVRAMRQRLLRFIGADAYQVNINTFHGFANEIIQTFPDKFEYSSDVKQLDDLSRIKIIRDIIENSESLSKLKPFHDMFNKERAIISAIQNLKKEGIDPEEYLDRVKKLKSQHKDNPKLNRKGELTQDWRRKLEKIETMEELFEIYSKYQEKLIEESFYDYEDMIIRVIDKFDSDEEFLAYYQEKFLFIHVDEYQDTNGGQNKIIKHLGSFDESPNIFVVGDDDQAIYRFQGANLENILFFTETFKNVQTIVTPVNYRSTQTILDIADSVIRNNSQRLVNQIDGLNKQLKSQLDDSSSDLKIEIDEFTNGDEEKIYISKEIQKLKESGVSLDEIAVLFRKNSHIEDYSQTFLKFDIPIQIEVSKNVLQSEHVNKLISILKIVEIYSSATNEEIYEVLMYDFLNIDPVDVYKLCNEATKERIGLMEKLISLIPTEESEEELTSIQKFMINIAAWHKQSFNVLITKLVELVLNESGLLDYLSSKRQEDSFFEELVALNSFFKYVEQQEAVNRDIRLPKFLNDLEIVKNQRLKISLPKAESKDDAINLLTAHSSKGLEFEYVFIANSIDKNWGGNRASYSILTPEVTSYRFDDLEFLDEKELKKQEKEFQVEDERRLFFVGITRAKKKVYITHSSEYNENGSVSTGTPSRFIDEIIQNSKESQYTIQKIEDEDIKIEADDYLQNLSLPKREFSLNEKEYLREALTTFKLSASALNTYLDSPEKFLLNYLIKLPKIKTKQMAMGIAIHSAMETLNKEFDGETFPAKQKMLDIYSAKLEKEFRGDDEFERTLEEGVGMLSDYYDKLIAGGSFGKAIEIEYNFGPHNVFLNMEGVDPIALTGRIDKMEKISNDEIKVVDYKTGSPKTRNDILGNTKASNGSIWRQLVFYKLMCELDPYCRPGKNSKNSKYNITQAEVNYVKLDRKKEIKSEIFEVTTQDLEQMKQLIVQVMTKVRNLEFPEVSDVEV